MYLRLASRPTIVGERIWGIDHRPGQKTERTGKGIRTPETPGSGPVIRQCDPAGGPLKNVIGLDKRRQVVE